LSANSPLVEPLSQRAASGGDGDRCAAPSEKANDRQGQFSIQRRSAP